MTSTTEQSFSDLPSQAMSDNVKRCINNIEKPINDSRIYRGLVLKNGLTTLLISDLDTEQSVASLVVAVGSLSEPKYLPGLAHFCEHLLSMGTKKYPEENEFTRFLDQNNGTYNAYTSTDHTNHFFSINTESLKPSLDRFAQFFIEPLFTMDAIKREINVINSEHENNIANDRWRLAQLESNSADPNHSFYQFATGTKRKLWDIPNSKLVNIREEMLNFHSKWYSSHLMYLTVLGKEDLNTLEELVVSLFGNIKEKNVDKPYWPDPIYKEKQLATKTIVVPVSYIRGLYVSFLIPDQTKFYESKPGAYLSALFEHKGRSSISTVLKERGWSTDFAAGMKSLARGIELFDIDVDLTEEGIDHVDDIIKLIFQFVNMLKREGPQKLYYEENKNISTMHFQFKDQISPLEYIKNLTSTLVYYSLEDVLTANYIIREWKPDLIENLLSYFRPENMKLTVVSKDFQNKINMVDRFYGTRYSISKIPMETLNDWNKDDLCKDLKMPLSNLFITTDFSLVPIDENDPDHPYIFHESPILRIWLKTDTEFRFPKGFVSVDFFSPKVSTDPLYCNIIALFVKLFNEYFSDYAYDATRAGLYLTLEPSTHGFKITINGFTQKMHILINTIIEKLLTFKINSLQFNIFKEEKIKQLKSAIMDQPCNTAILYSSIILSEVGWTTNELLASIYDVNIENIEEFIEEFFSHMFMESLIYGNIDKTKALEIIQILEKPFLARNDFRTLIPQQMLRKRAVQLEDGESILYETISACHSNSCVQIQFQCGVQSTINSVIVLLFSNIMQKTCGNILGTQEQSRYVVFGSSQVHFGVLSLYITVQSAHTPMYVHTKIESYIDTIQELLTNMTNEEFEKYKDALTAQLLEKPKNIMEQASAYQIEISTQTYSFNQMQMFVEALKSVTKSDIVQFYVDKISQSGPKRHKLAVHVKSTLKNTNNDKLSQSDNSLRANNNYTIITDITDFKKKHNLYPLPNPFQPVGLSSTNSI